MKVLNWNLKLEIMGRTQNSFPATCSELVGSQLSGAFQNIFFSFQSLL